MPVNFRPFPVVKGKDAERHLERQRRNRETLKRILKDATKKLKKQ
ncbi:hypothetical protein Desde_3133 [Desulfitobacterium dehalogenans ATCC 51507]|uniref:Uncharacterized protein n=1 Tax=Desulfitobacterium dehalogenans (strain ATCC 51507 / DSM 9161 / JW/IU-DC1) TaxID=756499 RepID=I4ABU0_DESDJ|nr:hypothetical protein Desde_3133 [Desulfitobacterium dehalogenans ATCC 51507]